jgi:putative NADH-flavin reductase
MDPAAVEAAVQGHDAVVCALGTPATTRNTVRSQGTANIVRAMETLGVRRLVCISSIGIGDSAPMLPWLYRWILVPLLLRQGFAEHELQEASIRQSATDWTVVRPGALTNGSSTGAYRLGAVVEGNAIDAKVSRADVAAFVAKELVAAAYVRATPWLSY